MNMYYLQSISKIFIPAIMLFFVAAGCSVNDSSNVAPKPVAVNMQVAGSSPAKAIQRSSSSNHVTLSSVKMLVQELELESVEEDSLDFEIENQVAELPLDGSPYQLSAQDISSGLYDEFELEIEGPEDDETINDPDFSDGSGTYSMVIRGTHNGEDFTFKTEEDFELEFEFNPPIEIDENTNSVDINLMINVDSWFVDPGTGNDLDPADPNNREQIEENIGNSFEADDDVDENDEDEDNDDDDDDGDDD